MIVEKYKSKYLNYVDDDLSIDDDKYDDKLILNETDDVFESYDFDDYKGLSDFSMYDEYEDEIGISDSGDEFDRSVFKIGEQNPVTTQQAQEPQIHTFDDLISFVLNTCERLKLECPQDLDRINCWVSNCQQQHLKPMSVEMNTPVDVSQQTSDLSTNVQFTSKQGFIPLQVKMISYDDKGNATEVDSGFNSNNNDVSIEDVCTVCADDEF